jgi:tetratricopeptide (TPR) repeat protein
VNRLTTEYPNAEDLQEAAFALLKDWRHQHQKRLVLLVDNLDLILEQMNDEQNNAELRKVLMNDGTIMLIGGATTFFHEARAYDQPLYNFFKIYNLSELQFSEIQDLLRQRAARDQIPDFERKLTDDPSRLRTLVYFTGGNPRLLLMLYQVVTQPDMVQVQVGLEKLLDEVTPYYKAKTESLPAQQRKILDHIARESAGTHEGVTPTAIATALRLPPNQMSSQLKRLTDLGYVRAANLRERSSYYALSEPLYAIWYQMRFGRDARQRMQWLVSFLQVWYEDAWYDLGVMLFNLGHYEEAISRYDRAVTIEPENEDAWYNRGVALAALGHYEKAIMSYDHAIAIKPEDKEAWNNRGVAFLKKSVLSINDNNRELATLNWREAWKSTEHVKKEKWYEVASTVLLFFSQTGHMALARQLLSEAQLEEPLFPLARALDFLLTGDEALVEKLSPEVKKLVEEIVEKLRPAGKPTKRAGAAQRVKKTRSGPRRRTAKQLH